MQTCCHRHYQTLFLHPSDPKGSVPNLQHDNIILISILWISWRCSVPMRRFCRFSLIWGSLPAHAVQNLSCWPSSGMRCACSGCKLTVAYAKFSFEWQGPKIWDANVGEAPFLLIFYFEMRLHHYLAMQTCMSRGRSLWNGSMAAKRQCLRNSIFPPSFDGLTEPRELCCTAVPQMRPSRFGSNHTSMVLFCSACRQCSRFEVH